MITAIRRALAAAAPPLAVAVAVIVALEVIVAAGGIADYLIPRPSRVWMALGAYRGELTRATLSTAVASLGGFALSAVAGVSLAVVLSAAHWVRRAFYPYAVLFQTVPLIAIAPLLVIWFGNGPRAVIASACIVSVFPVIANTLAGLSATDRALEDLFTLYRAPRLARLFKLRLPFAVPYILTGLRIGAGLSVIGAIVGEFVTTGTGLGGLITQARQLQRTELVFAGLILSALLGIAIFGLINLISALALRHRHAG